MNILMLVSFVFFMMFYLVMEWKNWAKTTAINKFMSVGICVLAFLIWAYLSSFLPTYHPSKLLECLEPLVPFAPITVPREG